VLGSAAMRTWQALTPSGSWREGGERSDGSSAPSSEPCRTVTERGSIGESLSNCYTRLPNFGREITSDRQETFRNARAGERPTPWRVLHRYPIGSSTVLR
jgi:hypothetical protein